MPTSPTRFLARIHQRDPHAFNELYGALHEQLRKIASAIASGQNGQTMGATALVNEAYLRLGRCAEEAEWLDCDHFLRCASMAMRHILIDYKRSRMAEKRPDAHGRVPLDDIVDRLEQRSGDLLEVDEALKKLADMDESLARLVELRFFAGQKVGACANALGMSARTAARRLRIAKMWLRQALA